MSDHPDYFGTGTFPYYGTYLEQQRLLSPIPDTDREDVFNIAAKARIYGLYLNVSSVGAFDGVDIIMTIDGDELIGQTIDELFAMQWAVENGFPLKLALYDTVAGEFTFVGATDINFNASYQLEIDNDSGGDIFVSGAVHYARVV